MPMVKTLWQLDLNLQPLESIPLQEVKMIQPMEAVRLFMVFDVKQPRMEHFRLLLVMNVLLQISAIFGNQRDVVFNHPRQINGR